VPRVAEFLARRYRAAVDFFVDMLGQTLRDEFVLRAIIALCKVLTCVFADNCALLEEEEEPRPSPIRSSISTKTAFSIRSYRSTRVPFPIQLSPLAKAPLVSQSFLSMKTLLQSQSSL
jgi:hypothetical protein